MAGGIHAQTIPCSICFACAERTYEGIEDDHYLCDKGHRFGIDWSRGDLPQTPQWPPSEEAHKEFLLIQAIMGQDKDC